MSVAEMPSWLNCAVTILLHQNSFLECAGRQLPGDANGDGTLDIPDPVAVLDR